MRQLSDANHPLWAFLTMTVLLIFLYGVLRIFANEFDVTEWRTLGLYLVGSGVLETAKHYAIKYFRAKYFGASENESGD